MQAVICWIALLFMNGAYTFISFNMESMIPENEHEQIEETIVSVAANMEFDPADVLELDILDFAVDELMDKDPNTSAGSRWPHLVHDRV
jgi:hypothetical protein